MIFVPARARGARPAGRQAEHLTVDGEEGEQLSEQATIAVLKDSRARGAARMVLFVIASHVGEGEHAARVSMDTIAREANASSRAVQYAVAELEARLGEIVVAEKGGGKGHLTLFDLSPLLSNGATSAGFQGGPNPEQVAPFETERAQAKGANLSSKGADFSGTRVAPSKAETTSTKTEADASGAARGAGEYIGRLLKLRREDLGVRQLPAEKPEAVAAKWMYGQGWPVEEVEACYAALKKQKWRGTDVTLMVVKGQFPAWRKGDLKDAAAGQRHTGSNPRTETIRQYDYSVFRGGEGAGARNGAGEVPHDAELEPHAAGRPPGDGRRVAGNTRR